MLDKQSIQAGLIGLLFLNLLDLGMTLYWVLNSYTNEANPVMATPLEAHPVLFAFCKFILVTGGVYILYKRVERKLAKHGALVACLLYSLVAGGHIGTFLYIYVPSLHPYWYPF